MARKGRMMTLEIHRLQDGYVIALIAGTRRPQFGTPPIGAQSSAELTTLLQAEGAPNELIERALQALTAEGTRTLINFG
jgi:hypothetical protein